MRDGVGKLIELLIAVGQIFDQTFSDVLIELALAYVLNRSMMSVQPADLIVGRDANLLQVTNLPIGQHYSKLGMEVPVGGSLAVVDVLDPLPVFLVNQG